MSEPVGTPDRRRSRSRRRAAIALIAATVIGAIGLWNFEALREQVLRPPVARQPATRVPVTRVPVDPERAAARLADSKEFAAKRAYNIALAAIGQPLPGTPDLSRLTERLAEHGVKRGSAVLIRIFKREHELELWLARDGRFHRFATYPICRWSGGLGPKFQTGDHQAPEGFYTVSAAQMNANSRWFRSFNLGFPNAFDRSHGRTGSALMVHGGCSSVGCYAMTNAVMGEIWDLLTAAFQSGQSRIQVQAFPFRMTDEAMAAATGHPEAVFWRNLKRGYDQFEAKHVPPAVAVCHGTYRFETASIEPGLTPPIKKSCRPKRGLAGVSK